MKKRTEELVKLAAQDIITAVALEKNKLVWDGKICTEVHASIEKGIKALIVELGGVETTQHPTESLIEDYEELSEEALPEEFEDIISMDECAVGTRYKFQIHVTLTRRQMVQLGTDFHKWVRSKLK